MTEVSDKYREIADRIWDMSKEYESSTCRDISWELKQISQKLHDMARMSELHNEDPYLFPLTPIDFKIVGEDK
jgi:hypothetical protein